MAASCPIFDHSGRDRRLEDVGRELKLEGEHQIAGENESRLGEVDVSLRVGLPRDPNHDRAGTDGDRRDAQRLEYEARPLGERVGEVEERVKGIHVRGLCPTPATRAMAHWTIGLPSNRLA